MKEGGVAYPIANGGTRPDDGQKFEAALAGISPAAYRTAIMNLDAKALKGPEVKAAFAQVRKIADWMDPNTAAQHYSINLQRFIAGDMGMMIQGGWAQGVLLNAGFKLDDFIIAPGPSENTKPVFLLNADAFIFWQRKEPDLQAGQTLMAQLVMDPAIQTMYSQITGSIPVRTDVDLSGAGWSDGQRRTAAALKEAVASNQAVLSVAHNMAQENGMTAAMIDVITEYVKNKAITPDQAVARLSDAVEGGALTHAAPATTRTGRPSLAGRLPEYLTIWVPLLLSAGHLVSFALWTIWISFTPSTLVPVSGWVGLRNYTAVMATRNWKIAFDNLLLFGCGFVLLSLLTGLLLAILLDQRIRGENVLRSIFLYPLAVSFVVTGTVWSWLLNPGIGIQKLVNDFGWTSFRFDWLIDRDMAIWTIVIAAVWQASGFAMALFLAGLRSVDADLIKAAQIDGAGPIRMYRRVILPDALADHRDRRGDPAAVRHHDLRPRPRADRRRARDIATQLPALVVYDFMFQRGQLRRGAAAAVLMLLILLAVLLPYAAWRYVQRRRAAHA